MRLENKVVIVTGGGTGIGRGICELFAKEGARIVIAGRKMNTLEQTALSITSFGGKSIPIQCDVSQNSQVTSLVERAITQYGGIDVLVNNAGVYLPHDALGASEEEWNITMEIDLKGIWICSKAVLPHMISKGRGKIINIASIAGLIGFEQSAAYCAAKGAVVNLTRSMALDYASKGICVNAIAPGVIETDMTKSFLSDELSKKSFLEKIPVGRIGIPEDIAYGALYLASAESDYVTGQTHIIDGGWTIK